MTEVRLEANDPAQVESLLRAGKIGGFSIRPGEARRRIATLFDTEDWALARARLRLELRRRGAGWELAATWERADSPPWRERRTALQALERAPRSPMRLSSGPLAERLGSTVADRPLRAVLSVAVTRRTFEATARGVAIRGSVRTTHAGPPEGVLAARLDDVVVHAPASRRAAAEALVTALVDGFGLDVAPPDRADRALASVHGDRPFLEWTSGDPAPDDTVEDAARKVFGRHLRRVQAHDPGTRDGSDPEDLHDMRVATRRLRAALRVFGEGLPPEFSSRLARDLRWLGGRLGEVRDLDVQAGRLGDGPSPRLAAWIGALRDESRGRLLSALGSRRYLRLLRDLDRFSQGHAPEGTAPPARRERAGPRVAASLGRAHRRLLRAGRDAKREATESRLHEMRIRAKRLRYGVEFLEGAGGASAREVLRRLVDLQDLLGEHQDAVVSLSLLRRYRAGRARDRAATRIEDAQREAAATARRKLPKLWRRIEGKGFERELGKVIDAFAGKKKGDAASGVP